MSFEFAPAKRENVPLLIGLAGGTGSGKTYSAMRLAKGLAGDKPFAVIDTENGRARHYADEFAFDVTDLAAPFTPERYADAIEGAVAKGYSVVVVDSMSHEYAGIGGLLEQHDEELERLGNSNKMLLAAWIKPKRAHKKMVTRLLQVPAHVILCFRAEQKIEMKQGAQGRTEIVLKTGLNVVDGWTMLTEKNLPYELTASLLLTAEAPGLPKPIKLQQQHRAMVPLDKPIGEETGKRLAEWASGGGSDPAPLPPFTEQADADFDFAPASPIDEENPEPLDAATFKRLCDADFISPQKVGAVGKQLFPGRGGTKELTDAERGVLWAELQKEGVPA